MVRLIAALDSKRGIADDHGIPWDLPTDKAFYRAEMQRGLVIMGAGTYNPKDTPLGNLPNYVVTHSAELLASGYEAVHDIAAFFQSHKSELITDIGGAGLFEQTIGYADELLLTQVDGDFHCSKFFPDFTPEFELVKESHPYAENGILFHFQTWHRK